MSLLFRGARVVNPADASSLESGCVRIRGDRIVDVALELAPIAGERVLEAGGRVLMPGFVDAHTHALWAGDRWTDFERVLRGETYAQIARTGGGILSTVRAVRAASVEQLASSLKMRLGFMLREGTTTMEVKSGYGLDAPNELKMLRAIDIAARDFRGTVVKTALLGHAIDPEIPNFVEYTIEETLPSIHDEFPGIAVDAFCEASAWSLPDCRRLLQRAAELGHPLRLHVDQFTRLGGLALASELGLRSADHLEASTEADLTALAQLGTFGVVLPATAFHLGTPYAQASHFLRAGGRLVLASNLNPGSAPCSSMPLVVSLAARHTGISMDQALRAVTSTAAELLGFSDRGYIAPGGRADLILLRHRNERQLVHEFGGDPVECVVAGGRVVRDLD
ncbi:MAG: imidazolonepropionase [Myxococcota bacterium]